MRWLALMGQLVLVLGFWISPVWAQKEPERAKQNSADKTIIHTVTPLTGSLSVISNPTGARIYLDGKMQGSTTTNGQMNKSLMLKPGHYNLVVKHPDYQD